MTSWLSLPVLGAGALFAAATGLHLGNSAIADINPIHFRGPALHPRDRGAAIDETELAARLARQPMRYDQLYGWEEGLAAREADCAGCAVAARDSRSYQPAVPDFGSAEEIRAADRAARRESDRRYERRLALAAEREAHSRNILRYADFPLTEEEMEKPLRAALDESEPSFDD